MIIIIDKCLRVQITNRHCVLVNLSVPCRDSSVLLSFAVAIDFFFGEESHHFIGYVSLHYIFKGVS